MERKNLMNDRHVARESFSLQTRTRENGNSILIAPQVWFAGRSSQDQRTESILRKPDAVRSAVTAINIINEQSALMMRSRRAKWPSKEGNFLNWNIFFSPGF